MTAAQIQDEAIASPVVIDAKEAARLTAGLADVAPWSGHLDAGRGANFLGVITPLDPNNKHPAREVTKRGPVVADGEGFSEWVSTSRAIARANKRFTMVSLGAHFGGPMVNAVHLLRAIKPMPYRLVGVEGDPNMCAMVRDHFAENSVGTSNLTVVNAVVGADNKPVIFPCTATRTGANAAISAAPAIDMLVQSIKDAGHADEALAALLRNGTTGLFANLNGTDVKAELRLMSTVTLGDILGPLDHVDYLEIDIQSAEYASLPPFIKLIARRVGWVHLGTHGQAVHEEMAEMFRANGFRIEVNWAPETTFETPNGSFRTQDGVLAVANPNFD
jgi:hypothetical protein